MKTNEGNEQSSERIKLAMAHQSKMMPVFVNFVSRFIDDFEENRYIKLLLRYMEGYTNAEIAKENGITPERTRQLINKAVEIIKNFDVKQTAEYKTLQEDFANEQFINKAIKERLESIPSKIDLFERIRIIEGFLYVIKRKFDDYNYWPTMIPLPPIEEQPIFIKDLDISTRLRNALVYNNIDTLSQLAELDPVVLEYSRNCGRKTVKEAADLLASHGMSFSKPLPSYYDKL